MSADRVAEVGVQAGKVEVLKASRKLEGRMLRRIAIDLQEP